MHYTILDPITIPISGSNLIEASAGTGKTYNIAALFTRLIAVEHFDVSQILVVTFSKNATAELKNRLRHNLDNALRCLKSVPNAHQNLSELEEKAQDDTLFRLLCAALKQEPNQDRLQLRLKAAISNFDNAAIYTIHGFCQRVLKDFAFYCQVPFDIELDETRNEHNIIAAQDFWRTNIANHTDLSQLVYHYQITPQSLLEELETFVGRPYLVFRQPEKVGDLSQIKTQFEQTWHIILPMLSQIEAAFWAIHLSLNYYKKETYKEKFQQLQLIKQPDIRQIYKILSIETNRQDPETKLKIKKIVNPFGLEQLTSCTRKNAVLDADALHLVLQLGELGDICLAYQAAAQAAQIKIAQDLIVHLRQANEAHKKQSPIRHFDDLLLDVFFALQPNREHAQALADALAKKWPVALIDEFQDTDPIQYGIFHTAFTNTRNKNALFMVGDPKQAIYGFRGADIFTYMNAFHDASASYSLNTNFRSHQKLINSIEALFSRDNPFALKSISYVHVQANRQHNALPKGNRAVRLSWLNQEENETSETLQNRAAKWCAQEISHILQTANLNCFHLENKNRNIAASDIAILVRTRKEGSLIQRELKKYNIQSVLINHDNIFGEDEAYAIYALLSFILAPQKMTQLVYVLSSKLFNYTADQIMALNQDESALTQWTDYASLTHQIWQKEGIFAALQQFFTSYQTEQHLLAQGNERTLTNLHQIMELLAEQDEQGITPATLHQWLGTQIDAAKQTKTTDTNATLRLESDEDLVKIVTMHASKGLEYPIVYCPFAWKRSNQDKDDWVILHNEMGSAQLINQKYQMNQNDKELIKQETLSEELRLLYVAFTRACEQLNIYLASYRDSNSSALAYLFNETHHANKADIYAQTIANFVAQQDKNLTDFSFNQTGKPNCVVPDHLPLDEQNIISGSLNYQAQHYPKRSFRFISHNSFTSLSRQTQRAYEANIIETEDILSPALDVAEQIMPDLETSQSNDIADFPKGAKAGICLHEILEKYDFSQSSHNQSTKIAQILQKHQFDSEKWLPTIEQLIDNTRYTPLTTQTSLAMLEKQSLLPEMGFLFHTTDFKLRDIKNWFIQHSKLPENITQAAQELSFYNIEGFVNGFIDLVVKHHNDEFLIIDYKSNHLPNDDYSPAALNNAIAEHHYYLQAFIYAIALARYLARRQSLPQKICIRYLFLRGLDGISQNGVWSWDIDTKTLMKWI